MIEIRRLVEADIAHLKQVVSGYRSDSKYEVTRTEAEDQFGTVAVFMKRRLT